MRLNLKGICIGSGNTGNNKKESFSYISSKEMKEITVVSHIEDGELVTGQQEEGRTVELLFHLFSHKSEQYPT